MPEEGTSQKNGKKPPEKVKNMLDKRRSIHYKTPNRCVLTAERWHTRPYRRPEQQHGNYLETGEVSKG
jgi:hypothetical protein